MLIEQIWVGNDYRNFNYLIACAETGEALAVDPLDFRQCLSVAKDKDWDIRWVLNTHEHPDHIGGNKALISATGAKLIAHHNSGDRIRGIDRGVGAGDIIKVGKTVELECMDTPGHTMCHICLKTHSDDPALFSGDTLFNAGAGNCHNGGHPEVLYETFEQQLENLSPDTRLYPGHEYLSANLRFTLDREPGNQAAAALLADIEDMDPANPVVTTLGQEKDINTFFRLDNETVIDGLREKFPELPDKPSRKEVFLKLRELRNSW
ncbi:MAG: hydroxyacylglutathione hydrolase [Pseudomonadota bacterium]